jgi:hypothetical protein
MASKYCTYFEDPREGHVRHGQVADKDEVRRVIGNGVEPELDREQQRRHAVLHNEGERLDVVSVPIAVDIRLVHSLSILVTL